MELITRTICLPMLLRSQEKSQLLKALGKFQGVMLVTSTVLHGSQPHKENLYLSQTKA